MKSPIKDKPLHNPGESLDHEIRDLVFDGVLGPGLIALLLALVAGLEWWRWYASLAPNPIPYTVFAGIALAYATWRIRRAIARVRRLKLGRDGEKAVGQFLDRLREKGARVFHDVVSEGFNLDHVVVHTTGIYSIETKTLSKPDRGEARLVFDGTTVSRGGIASDRNPVIQAKAGARWLRTLLEESTGRRFSTRAVVVYPGWYVERTSDAKTSEVWVLNPKALPAFIANSAERLSPEEVSLCAYHLSRYVRTA